MILYINNKEKKYDNSFIRFLIHNIRIEFGARIDHDKARQWDEYLNDKELSGLDFGDRKVKALDILYMGVSRLVFRKYKDLYMIEIRPYDKIYGSNERLARVCNLITYGTMDMQGYPVILEAFAIVEKKMNKLYRLYRGG